MNIPFLITLFRISNTARSHCTILLLEYRIGATFSPIHNITLSPILPYVWGKYRDRKNVCGVFYGNVVFEVPIGIGVIKALKIGQILCSCVLNIVVVLFEPKASKKITVPILLKFSQPCNLGQNR